MSVSVKMILSLMESVQPRFKHFLEVTQQAAQMEHNLVLGCLTGNFSTATEALSLQALTIEVHDEVWLKLVGLPLPDVTRAVIDGDGSVPDEDTFCCLSTAAQHAADLLNNAVAGAGLEGHWGLIDPHEANQIKPLIRAKLVLVEALIVCSASILEYLEAWAEPQKDPGEDLEEGFFWVDLDDEIRKTLVKAYRVADEAVDAYAGMFTAWRQIEHDLSSEWMLFLRKYFEFPKLMQLWVSALTMLQQLLGDGEEETGTDTET